MSPQRQGAARSELVQLRRPLRVAWDDQPGSGPLPCLDIRCGVGGRKAGVPGVQACCEVGWAFLLGFSGGELRWQGPRTDRPYCLLSAVLVHETAHDGIAYVGGSHESGSGFGLCLGG